MESFSAGYRQINPADLGNVSGPFQVLLKLTKEVKGAACVTQLCTLILTSNQRRADLKNKQTKQNITLNLIQQYIQPYEQ